MPSAPRSTTDHAPDALTEAVNAHAIFVGDQNPIRTAMEGPQRGPLLKGQTPAKQRTWGILQTVRDVVGRLMPQRSAPSSGPRTVKLNLEGLERYIMPSATMSPVPLNEALIASNPTAEHYTEAVTVNFDPLAAGANANNSIVEYADTGRLRISTGTGQSFIQENGSIRSGANGNDHVIVSLLDGQRFVKSITYHSIGSGAGLINVSDTANHYSSISGSGTLTVNRFGDQISMVVQSGGIVLDSITFEVDRIDETLPAPDSAQLIVLEAALTQAQADKVQAQAVLADLVAHPVTETVQQNTSASVNFSSIAPGNLPDGATLNLPSIGAVTMHRGGSTPISITGDGAARTGANGGHLVGVLPDNTFVETVTMRYVSGSGNALANFGNGYQSLSGTKTFTLNQVASNVIIVVYGNVMYEVSNITVRVPQTTQVPTAAYTSALQAAQAAVTSLNTQIATLTQQRDAQAAADAAANANLFIAAESDEGGEAEPVLTTVNFSSLAQMPLTQVTTVNLGDLGSTKIEQGGSHALQVVGSGLQAGSDGRDHVVLTFRDGQKFITSVKVTNLGGGGTRLAIGADEGPTRYIDINASGIINIGQLVRTIAIVSSGNGGARLEEVTQDEAQGTIAPLTQNWQQTEDTLRRGGSPGYLALGRFAPNAVGIRRDPSQYSVIKLIGTNDRAVATNVRYHTAGGDAALPAEYFDLIDGFVVLHPGAPEQIVIYMGNPDGHDPQGINVDIHHRQSATLEEILPPELMTIRTDILAIRDINSGSEGVAAALMEIPDTGRAVTPTQGKAVMNVWNDGRQGGTVRVITGYGTPQAHEISFQLGAQQGKSVTINFTVPANGVLSVTTILPDGRIVTDGRTLKTQGETSDRRVATRQPDGTWKLEWKGSNYTGPTVVDNGIVDNNFVIWKQERISKGDLSVADPANYDRAVLAYAEELLVHKRVAEAATSPDSDFGNGGADEPNYAPGVGTLLHDSGLSSIPTEARNGAIAVAGQLKRQIFDQALGWLPSSAVQGNTFVFNGQGLMRCDTVAGRILAGGIQSLWNTTDTTSRWNMAFQLQVLTDIPANRFIAARSASATASAFGIAMSDLIAQAQYGHLLQSSQLPSGIIMVTPDRDVAHPYTDPKSSVRLRFDLTMNLQHIRNIGVYNGSALLAQGSGAAFIDIPATAFNQSGVHHLTLRITTDEGITKSMAVPAVMIGFLRVPDSAEGLQTLSSNAPNSTVERNILNHMRLPFAETDWSYGIYSEAHDGSGLYALDFNAPDDNNRGVHAPVAGHITDVNLREGKVVITSTLQDGTTWKTTFLHMDHILGENYEAPGEVIARLGLKIQFAAEIAARGGLTNNMTSTLLTMLESIPEAMAILKPYLDTMTVAEAAIQTRIEGGLWVNGWDTLGQGGNEGQSDGSHVHVSVVHNGKPVNLFAWADLYQEGMVATADVGNRRISMQYNSTIGTLVNVAERIALRRVDENGDGQSYAYAWEEGKTLEQMKRVVSKILQHLNANGVMETTQIWVDSTSDESRWDPIRQKFVNRLTGIEL